MSLLNRDGICRPEDPCLVVDECHCLNSTGVCDTPEYLSKDDRQCQYCGWPETEHDCD